MKPPKNCLPIKDAPRDGTFVLLVGDSDCRSTKYRAIVASYKKEYEEFKGSENCDQTELDMRCWRDTSNDHVTDSGEMPEWFMLPPWEYDNDNINSIAREVLNAVMTDNKNLPVFLMAGPTLFRLLALMYGLTKTAKANVIPKPVTFGITTTVLATQLAEAVIEDEKPEAGGFDLSAGMFGQAVSNWLRSVSGTISLLNSSQLKKQDLDNLLGELELIGSTDPGRTPDYFDGVKDASNVVEQFLTSGFLMTLHQERDLKTCPLCCAKVEPGLTSNPDLLNCPSCGHNSPIENWEKANPMPLPNQNQAPQQPIIKAVSAETALGHINQILTEKQEAGQDLELGSTAFKSCLDWSTEHPLSPKPDQSSENKEVKFALEFEDLLTKKSILATIPKTNSYFNGTITYHDSHLQMYWAGFKLAKQTDA